MYKVFLLKPIFETNTSPAALSSPCFSFGLCIKRPCHLKIARQHFCFVLLSFFLFFFLFSTMLPVCYIPVFPLLLPSWSVRGYSASSETVGSGMCAPLSVCVCTSRALVVYKKQPDKVFPLSSCIMHWHHLPSSGRKTSKMSNFSFHSESQTEEEMCYFDCHSRAKHLLHQ